MNISKEKTIEIAKIDNSSFLVKQFFWETNDPKGMKLIYEDIKIINALTRGDAIELLLAVIRKWAEVSEPEKN